MRFLFFQIYFKGFKKIFILAAVGSQLWCVGSSLHHAKHFCRTFCCVPRQLWCVGSVVVAHGLSCATGCGILVPQPGIEPTSPALAGGFLTTGPPGKSQDFYFQEVNFINIFLYTFTHSFLSFQNSSPVRDEKTFFWLGLQCLKMSFIFQFIWKYSQKHFCCWDVNNV